MIEALLDSLWKGAFVVAVAAIVAAVLPQRDAATRYSVWFAALIALVVLPLSGQFSFGEASSVIPSSVIHTTTEASRVTLHAANAAGLWLTMLWLTGFAVCIARLAVSFLRIGQIARSSVPAPHLGDDVFVSPLIAIPIAAGIFHPRIIVPEDVARTLEADDLAGIVAHERAHLRRGDVLGNLIQRLLESVLFFSPWAYIIARQLVKERESACDDWAVRSLSDPDRYATCLANLAQRNPRIATPLLTPSAIGSKRILIGRIARLINGKAGHVKTNYTVLAGAVIAFALLGFAFQVPRSFAATGNGAILASDANLPSSCESEATVTNPARPNISESAARAGANTQASVLVTIDADGHPSSVKVVKSSGFAAIDKAAADAAMQSSYKPEMRNCKAVSGGKYLFHVEVGP
jgi:bla regulator protein blaR1